MHRPPGTLSSFILRSRISCLFPLLCNEDDRDGLKGLGMVVWLGVGRKELGGVVKQDFSLGRPFVRKPGSSRLIITEINGSGAG